MSGGDPFADLVGNMFAPDKTVEGTNASISESLNATEGSTPPVESKEQTQALGTQPNRGDETKEEEEVLAKSSNPVLETPTSTEKPKENEKEAQKMQSPEFHGLNEKFEENVEFATQATVSVEAPVSGPRSGSGKAENLQMQIELLLKTIEQQKNQLARESERHRTEMSSLKTRFRGVQGKQKKAFESLKAKLADAVNKGRGYAKRNKDLVGRLQLSDQSRKQLMTEKQQLSQALQASRAQEQRLLQEHTKAIEKMKTAVASEFKGEQERLNSEMNSVLADLNEKQDLIDQIVAEQTMLQKMRCSIDGNPLNCTELKAQVDGIDGNVDFQWFRSVNSIYVPIEGATSGSYIPTADDIGTMLKCEVQSQTFQGAKATCECGPVLLDPGFQGLLHNFMQDLKNSKNSIIYKVYEANAEMFIVVNIEKLKIKNAKKKTVEKGSWTEVTKIVLSDDDPKSFTLQLSGKHKMHQFRVTKMRDREIITLLIRALYMRHVCTNYDPKQLYLRSLVAAAAQKARFAFAPHRDFEADQAADKVLVDRLRLLSSQQVREDSISTTMNIPNKIDVSSEIQYHSSAENILSVSPRTDVATESNAPSISVNTIERPDSKSDAFDLFGDLGGALAESAAGSDAEEANSGSEAEEAQQHKAIHGLEISDTPTAMASVDELNSAVASFGLSAPTSGKRKVPRKKSPGSSPGVKKKKKKRKRKRTTVTMELKEQYAVKLEDLQAVELKCTGQLSLQFDPAPPDAFNYPIQLSEVDHLNQISCNPQFVKDNGDNKYQVHVDKNCSELVAVMYSVHPNIVNRFLPIKAKCIWDFQGDYAKIVIHMKLNPSTKIPLTNVVYEIQLPDSEVMLVQNTPEAINCEIVGSILRWSLGELVPSEDSKSITAVVRSQTSKLEAKPVSLAFEATGHFGEKSIQVAATDNGDRFISGGVNRTSVIDTFQID